MLYLHCGWPKTGTTTLQTALAANRARLAAAGTVYPDRWTRREDNSHRLFEGKGGAEPAIAELVEFLEANAESDVLISSEVLSLRLLLNADSQQILAAMVGAAGEVTPVRCVWTLRRFDDMVHSVCLQRAKFGHEPSVAELEQDLDVESLFGGMRAMADAAVETVYVRYSPSGRYEPEIAEALGVPAAVADAVDLTRAPRENFGLSHKQTATLLNLEAIAERLGRRIDGGCLRGSFERGELRFADDRRCELLDAHTRQDLHTHARAAAKEHGIAAYDRLFAEDQIAADGLLGDGPAALSAEDLDRLEEFLREAAPT